MKSIKSIIVCFFTHVFLVSLYVTCSLWVNSLSTKSARQLFNRVQWWGLKQLQMFMYCYSVMTFSPHVNLKTSTTDSLFNNDIYQFVYMKINCTIFGPNLLYVYAYCIFEMTGWKITCMQTFVKITVGS